MTRLFWQTPEKESVLINEDSTDKKIKPKPKTKVKSSVKQVKKESESKGFTAERDSVVFTTLNRLKD